MESRHGFLWEQRYAHYAEECAQTTEGAGVEVGKPLLPLRWGQKLKSQCVALKKETGSDGGKSTICIHLCRGLGSVIRHAYRLSPQEADSILHDIRFVRETYSNLHKLEICC